jgi:hypothetical protein
MIISGHLIFFEGNDPQYLDIAHDIYIKLNNKASFIDFTSYEQFCNKYSTSALRLLRLSNPSELFYQKHFRNIQSLISFIEIENSIPFSIIQSLEDSVESTLITLLGDPDFKFKKQIFKSELYSLLLKESIVIFKKAKSLFTNYKINEISMPNGRGFSQKPIQLAAQTCKLPINFYEKGDASSNYFYNNFEPQDRVSVQKYLNNFSSRKFTPNENFLSTEQKNYGLLWESESTFENSDNKKVVSIFTSSQDEFLALGRDWASDGWGDQFRGIEQVSQYFSNLGFKVFIRLHPNSVNKPLSVYRREVNRYKFISTLSKNIEVIMPSENKNSTELIRISHVVVVWNSTIALESTKMNVKTITLAPSLYDLCIDVKRVQNIDELMLIDSFNWTTDSIKSIMYESNYKNLYVQIADNIFSKLIFKNSHARSLYHLISLLRIGGSPTLISSLTKLFSTLLNRGLYKSLKLIFIKLGRGNKN